MLKLYLLSRSRGMLWINKDVNFRRQEFAKFSLRSSVQKRFFFL
jgi:hypothetical protein